MEQFGLSRPDSNRPIDDYPIQQPPSRNSSAQDANLHALLNNRAREATNRDFLLNLMQQPSRGTPPQPPHHHLPRPAPENPNLPFFDQVVSVTRALAAKIFTIHQQRQAVNLTTSPRATIKGLVKISE